MKSNSKTNFKISFKSNFKQNRRLHLKHIQKNQSHTDTRRYNETPNTRLKGNKSYKKSPISKPTIPIGSLVHLLITTTRQTHLTPEVR